MIQTIQQYLFFPFVRYASHILHVGHEMFFGPTAEYIRSAAARRFLGAEGGKDA